MTDKFDRADITALARVADGLESMAETMELMGDERGAAQWRAQAVELRLEAMRLIDD